MPHVTLIYPASALDLADAIDFSLSNERYELERMALGDMARADMVRDNIVMADWPVLLVPPAFSVDPNARRQLDALPIIPVDTLVLHWQGLIPDCLANAHWIDVQAPIRKILGQVRQLAIQRQRRPHPALLVLWTAANILRQ